MQLLWDVCSWLVTEHRTSWDGPDTFYHDLFVVVPRDGLHINEISLSSRCKLFPRNRAYNHALWHRSLPLFLTFLTQRLKDPQNAGADVGIVTLCLLKHHAWRHQKSAIKVVQWAVFMTTVSRMILCPEWFSEQNDWAFLHSRQVHWQIYISVKSQKSNLTNLGISRNP